MEGLELPMEIQRMIVRFAIAAPPLDPPWNRRMMQEWDLTIKDLIIPVLKTPANVHFSRDQVTMLCCAYYAVYTASPSLLIESHTRAGKTTLLLHLLRILFQNVTPHMRILFIGYNKRFTELAKRDFLELLGNPPMLPFNVRFDVNSPRLIRGGEIVLYDAAGDIPEPMFGVTTFICTYSRWVDPRGHLGNEKTLDRAPDTVQEYRDKRAQFSEVLSLPQK